MVYEGDARDTLEALVEFNQVNELFRVGRCTYRKPFHLWNSRTRTLTDFTKHFIFKIDNHNHSTKFSDGFAFFLAPVGFPIPPNSAGGGLGLFNTTTNFAESKNNIVTVEFDTFSNEEWDPPGSHVGINVNQVSSVVNANWDISSSNGRMAEVRIFYISKTKTLSVVWSYEGYPSPFYFVFRPSLSYHIDLRNVLPEWVTIGFSTFIFMGFQYKSVFLWSK